MDLVGRRFILAASAVLAVAALILSVRFARAEYYIDDNRGGQIGNYLTAFEAIAQSGERVRIEGSCLSACTVVLKLPPSRLCAGPHARFGFHAAWMPDDEGRPTTSHEGTSVLWTWYHGTVRKWIHAHGGLTRKMIYLRGTELRQIIPLCHGPRSASAKQAFGVVEGVRGTLFNPTPISSANW